MCSFLRKGPGPFFIAGLVVIIDQITKAIAVTRLASGPVPAIGDIISFSLVRNTGAAFGLFRYQTTAFIFISLIAIAFTIFYLIRRKVGFYLPFALILGGAVGNLIDRLRFGYVIDFVDLHFWPVFNIADSCITIGSIYLFIVILRGKDASHTL